MTLLVLLKSSPFSLFLSSSLAVFSPLVLSSLPSFLRPSFPLSSFLPFFLHSSFPSFLPSFLLSSFFVSLSLHSLFFLPFFLSSSFISLVFLPFFLPSFLPSCRTLLSSPSCPLRHTLSLRSTHYRSLSRTSGSLRRVTSHR